MRHRPASPAPRTAPPAGAGPRPAARRRPPRAGALPLRLLAASAVVALAASTVPPVPGGLAAQDPGERPRARDLGIPLEGTPGPLNAITDVAGVEVGHATLVTGEGRLSVGRGPVRTGVTAIFPRGRTGSDTAFAGWFALNGNGEMTGTTWIEESGLLEGPVLITNTHSVGVVRDAAVRWLRDNRPDFLWALPVVAETWDGALNDINGFHVRPEHAFEALDGARGGPVPEGNVGGGTGMVCHQFKGGIGTASRRLAPEEGGYVVGALVQCNYGLRRQLRIAGVPVGAEIPEPRPCLTLEGEPGAPWLRGAPRCPGADEASPAGPSAVPTAGGGAAEGGPAGGVSPPVSGSPTGPGAGSGSIIVVIATDAPLLPHQLERVAVRASLGIARMGGIGANSSGDIFLAFSTANREGVAAGRLGRLEMLPNDRITPVLEATVQATEEAIVNALLAAETMTGIDGYRVPALPVDRLLEVLRRHGRLGEAP